MLYGGLVQGPLETVSVPENTPVAVTGMVREMFEPRLAEVTLLKPADKLAEFQTILYTLGLPAADE